MKEQKDPVNHAFKKFIYQGEENLNDEEFKCLFEFWTREGMNGCTQDNFIKRYNSIIGKEDK